MLNGQTFISPLLCKGLVRNKILVQMANPIKAKAYLLLLWTFGKNSRQGAQTTIYCVLTDDDVNGKYYAGCRENSIIVRSQVHDESLAKKYFRRTKHLLSLA